MALKMSDNLRKNNEKEKDVTISKVRISDSLNSSKKNIDESVYFYKAGDLDNSMIISRIVGRDEIQKYLSMVVSGERYGFQKGLPYSGGVMLVSFDNLKEMVNRGDNIIKAECLDENGVLISIEYESYGNVENNKQGRRR